MSGTPAGSAWASAWAPAHLESETVTTAAPHYSRTLAATLVVEPTLEVEPRDAEP